MAAVTKSEAQEMLDEVVEQVRDSKDVKGVKTTTTTWMGRPGTQLMVHFQSDRLGLRAIVHKWEDEDVCKVTLVRGDAWRRPQFFKQFGEAHLVPFKASRIATAIKALLKEETKS